MQMNVAAADKSHACAELAELTKELLKYALSHVHLSISDTGVNESCGSLGVRLYT